MKKFNSKVKKSKKSTMYRKIFGKSYKLVSFYDIESAIRRIDNKIRKISSLSRSCLRKPENHLKSQIKPIINDLSKELKFLLKEHKKSSEEIIEFHKSQGNSPRPYSKPVVWFDIESGFNKKLENKT